MTTSTMTTAPLPHSLEVHVTLKEIRDGHPRQPNTCPIALAIIQKLCAAGYRIDHISVGGSYAYIDILMPRMVYKYRLPAEASRFIRQFDRDGDPSPTSFVLYLDDAYELEES